MTYYDDDIYPVSRITTGAIGELGQRIFILQAWMNGEIVSWVIEKEHALTLSRRIPQLLEEIRNEYPELGEPLVAAEPHLALSEPLQPAFRVGAIGLSYDRVHDLVVLTLQDVEDTGDMALFNDDEESNAVQVFTTRGQALLLSRQAQETVAAGRPLCPRCGEPIDDFGHFCLSFLARRRGRDDYLQ
jgi:uncharacterized repeat protein (TIGR03847 family)